MTQKLQTVLGSDPFGPLSSSALMLAKTSEAFKHLKPTPTVWFTTFKKVSAQPDDPAGD